MTVPITIERLAEIEAEIRALSPEERDAQFDLMLKPAEEIVRCAILLKVMREAGKNVSAYPFSPILLEIAEGRIDPVLAIKTLAAPQGVKRLLGELPMDDQRRVAFGLVPAVVMRDGKPHTKIVDLTTAPIQLVRQVVRGGSIRTPEEQLEEMSD